MLRSVQKDYLGDRVMTGCKKKFDGYHYCGERTQGSENNIYCNECKQKAREEGYYWVKYSEYENDETPEWVIMHWDSEWNEFILDGEFSIKERETLEIDERRIVRSE